MGNRRGRKRSHGWFWTVIVPGRRGLPDETTGQWKPHPPQMYGFRDKTRAKRMAGNIQGAKVQRMPPRARFWTVRRVVIALAVVAAIICFLRSR